MDILCVGMLRSCSTWQYEVVTHLVEGRLGGTRLGYFEGPEYSRLAPASRDGLRVVKAHHRHPLFAERIAEGTAIPIYAYRDLRDVVFSMAHKFGRSFDELLAEGKLHGLLDDDRFWRSQPGVLIQRYEEIIAKPITSVRELAARIGVALQPGEAGRIASEYSFESNLKRTDALTRRLQSDGVDLSDVHNVVRHDPATLLHWNHLRSGRVGSWREEATISQRRIMADLFGEWLERTGYELDDLPPPTGSDAIESSTAAALIQGAAWSPLAGTISPDRELAAPTLMTRLRSRLPRWSKWIAGSRGSA
ncbi:MAG: sulfotransferase domain-containing protein [Isosphaeraceae bacterium]|nr:sulfotransferase domain-containing protein [Isosphaeraceae bacterium]